MMKKNKFQPTRFIIVVFCLLLFLLPAGLTIFPLTPSQGAYFNSRRDFNSLRTPTATPTPEPQKVIDATPMPDSVKHPRELTAEDYLDGSLGSTDFDCDGIKNSDDNCGLVYNPNQKDTDQDELGDACDNKPRVKVKANNFKDYDAQYSAKIDSHCDLDGDGIFNQKDNCPLVCNPDQRDKDKDKIGDACEAQNGIIQVCQKSAPLRR